MSGTHRTSHRSFARADLDCGHETLAQREVRCLIHEESGPRVMQRKGGKLLVQHAAKARGHGRKNLRDIPVRRKQAGHIGQHLQPVCFVTQLPIKLLNRFLEFSGRRYLQYNRPNPANRPLCIHDGKIMGDPVAAFFLRGKLSGELESHWPLCLYYLRNLFLDSIGKFSQNLPQSSSQVIFCRDAVHIS